MTMDHHMMQNGSHGNNDKFHCHLCNFDGRNIEEFDLHMNSEVHMQRLASISSLCQARTEQQVQRMKAEQMLRKMEKDDSDICQICQKKVQSFSEHRDNPEHVRKERMCQRGCILCKTGVFDNYPSYVAHIDSESHKQAKNKLNVDLEMKKKDPSESSGSKVPQRRQSSESHEFRKRHGNNDSHGRHTQSRGNGHTDKHQNHQQKHQNRRRGSSEKRDREREVSSSVHHRQRGERKTSSERLQVNNSQRAPVNSSGKAPVNSSEKGNTENATLNSSERVLVNSGKEKDVKLETASKEEMMKTTQVDLKKVKSEPMEQEAVVEEEELEIVQEELSYDPDNAVGQEFVIPVKGYFCKLCHKFYNSEDMAKNTHCKAEKHFEKYQEYVISQQQEINDAPATKPAQATGKSQVSVKTEKGSSNIFHSHKKNSMDQEMQNLSIKISNVHSASKDVDFQDSIDSQETMEVEANKPSNGSGVAACKRETLNQNTNRRMSRRDRNK